MIQQGKYNDKNNSFNVVSAAQLPMMCSHLFVVSMIPTRNNLNAQFLCQCNGIIAMDDEIKMLLPLSVRFWQICQQII